MLGVNEVFMKYYKAMYMLLWLFFPPNFSTSFTLSLYAPYVPPPIHCVYMYVKIVEGSGPSGVARYIIML